MNWDRYITSQFVIVYFNSENAEVIGGYGSKAEANKDAKKLANKIQRAGRFVKFDPHFNKWIGNDFTIQTVRVFKSINIF